MASRQEEAEINEINQGLRAWEPYREWLRSKGVNPDLPMKMNDRLRKDAARWLDSQGFPMPSGLEIDPAGNLNQNEGFGKQLKTWGPIAAAVAVSMFGIPGTAVTGFLSGAGGAASGGLTASGALQSSTNPLVTSSILGGAGGGGIASQGVTGALAAGGAASSTAGGGMGAWDLIKKGLGYVARNPGKVVGAAGDMLKSGSEASAENRGAKVDVALELARLNQDGERDYRNAVLDREKEGREGETDAWKKVQQASYVQNWKPTEQKFSPYTRDLVAPGADVVAGAAPMGERAGSRLRSGNPLPEIQPYRPTEIDPSLLNGSAWEKVSGYLGSGLSAWDRLSRGLK